MKRDKKDPRKVDQSYFNRIIAARARTIITEGKGWFSRLKLSLPLNFEIDIKRRQRNMIRKWYGRSTWMPHQGAKECARRRRQMGTGEFAPK